MSYKCLSVAQLNIYEFYTKINKFKYNDFIQLINIKCNLTES